MEAIKTVREALQVFGDSSLGFVLAIAMAGTLAMAILQLLKELTPVRRWFQKSWLEKWFTVRTRDFNVQTGLEKPAAAIDGESPVNNNTIADTTAFFRDVLRGPAKVAPSLTALVELATGGDEKAFYDLITEQLVAQMNAAAQAALEYPVTHAALLAILSQGAAVDDVVRVILGPRENPERLPDTEFLNARNRVAHRIQRNLDGLQISLGGRWKLWMQSISIALTVAIVEVAIFVSPGKPDEYAFVSGILVGIVGGYIAPVTRDIVAAVQSLRVKG